jgi:hypothetical protein
MSGSTVLNLSNQCLNIGFQKIASSVFLAYATPIHTAVNATMQAMVSAETNPTYPTSWTTLIDSYNGTNLYTTLETVSTNAASLITEANALAQVYTLGNQATITAQGNDNLLYHLNRSNLAFNQLADSVQDLMVVFGYSLVQNNDTQGTGDWLLGSQSSSPTSIVNLAAGDQEILLQLAANLSVAFNNIANSVNTQVNSVPSWSLAGLSGIQVYLSYVAQQATEQSSYSTTLESTSQRQRESLAISAFVVMPSQYDEYLAAQTALFQSMYLSGEYFQDIYEGIHDATIFGTSPTPGSTPTGTPDLTPTLTSN